MNCPRCSYPDVQNECDLCGLKDFEGFELTRYKSDDSPKLEFTVIVPDRSDAWDLLASTLDETAMGEYFRKVVPRRLSPGPGRPPGRKAWWNGPLKWVIQIAQHRCHPDLTHQEMYGVVLEIARDHGPAIAGGSCRTREVDGSEVLVIVDPSRGKEQLINLRSFSKVRKELRK